MIDYLKGKKTYIVAGAAAGVVFLQMSGLISSDTANSLYGLFGAGAIATIRAAIAKGF